MVDASAAAGSGVSAGVLPGVRARILAFAALLVVASAAFAPCVRNGFILDDVYMVDGNPALRSLANVPALFVSVPPGAIARNYYRPATLSAYALDYALFGPGPAGLHAMNVVWHVIAALLVWILLQQLGASRPAASVAALLFTVHPVQGETVYLINGRAGCTAAVWFFLGLSIYLGRREQAWSWPALGALAACFFLALGSKETAVTLPLVMLAVDVLLPGRERIRPAPYVACAAALLLYFGLRLALCEPSSISYFGDQSNAAVLRAMSVVEAYALSLVFFPRSLAGTYDNSYLPEPSGFGDPIFLASVALLIGVGVFAIAVWRRWPRVALGIAIYVITLLPTCNIIRSPVLFGERFLYLPLLGVGLVLCAALDAIKRATSWRATVLGLVVLSVFWAHASHVRAYEWRTETSYWRAAVRMRPEAIQTHVGLANALYDRHLLREALPHFIWAVEHVPPEGAQARQLYGRTASCASLAGDQPRALAIVDRWLAAQPADVGFRRMHDTLASLVARQPATPRVTSASTIAAER
jgi:hypothetical protein